MLHPMRRNVWLLAFAVIGIIFTFSAQDAIGCSVSVTYPHQVLVRRAAIVAEGVATAQPFTFQIEKVWKGSVSGVVKLSGPSANGSPCDTYWTTVSGDRYMLLMEVPSAAVGGGIVTFSGPTKVIAYEAAVDMRRYLAHAKRISRRDVISALENWQAGRMTNEAFARWLRETTPIADVDDWTTVEGSEESSLSLTSLHRLNSSINASQRSVDELSCEFGVLRNRVIPAILVLLRAEYVTEELLEAAEDEIELLAEPCVDEVG
jgi:hypothetical protein